MNVLYTGLNNDIELPKAEFLYIGDAVPTFPQARIFDPSKHSFNPLKNLDYNKICDIVDIFDALFNRGDSTLTKDTGLDFVGDALGNLPKKPSLENLIKLPDKKAATGHVWAYSKMQRILRSPTLTRVFCGTPNFHFNPNSVILVRLNRAELRDFDALALALFIMAEWKGQFVIDNYGPYMRPNHINLLDQGRLIAGVHTLSELDDKKLRDRFLLHKKSASQCIYDDAVEFAKYRPGLLRDTDQYHTFIEECMRGTCYV